MKKRSPSPWDEWNKIPGSKYPHEKVVQFCFRNFPSEKRSKTKVLDLGCGRGVHTEFLAVEGFQVSACDFSVTAVACTQKRIKDKKIKAKIYRAGIQEDYTRGGMFDLIICIGVLDAAGPMASRKCIQNLKKSLYQGGLGLFIFMSEGDTLRKNLSSFKIHPFTRKSVENMFGSCFSSIWIDRYETSYENESFIQRDWIVTVKNEK